MSTESEVKLARYRAIEKEPDDFGRVIGVRRLKPSEQARLSGMTADVTGSEKVQAADGIEVEVSHRFPFLVAASVSLIDEVHIPFPKNRGELDAMLDRLDTEGIEAAGKAMVRLTSKADTPENPKDETKNL
jgi:hypothetical protein